MSWHNVSGKSISKSTTAQELEDRSSYGFRPYCIKYFTRSICIFVGLSLSEFGRHSPSVGVHQPVICDSTCWVPISHRHIVASDRNRLRRDCQRCVRGDAGREQIET